MSDITDQIIGAWEEEEPSTSEETVDVVEEEQPEQPEVETEEETETEEEVETEETDEVEQPEEEVETEEEPEPEEEVGAIETDDPAVLAYLAKYQNDPERALKAAAVVQDALARQGHEKTALVARVSELEQELAQARTFSQSGLLLTEDQREWVDEAVNSGNQRAYVQRAIQAGEFDLARAVCATWAQDEPYEALRISQAVDTAEWQTQQQAYEQNGGGQLDHPTLMGILVDNFPEMPQYEEQMVSTISQLGDVHPLVQDARSADPQVAARGIIGIYEISRARTATVQETRKNIQTRRTEATAEARRKGVVSSGGAAPSPGETPAPHRLGPGLTLEQLDEAWGA